MSQDKKPVVRYRGEAMVIHGHAFLLPVDHPNHLEGQYVSNEATVRTSQVIDHDPKTGRIETKNTIYVPDGSGTQIATGEANENRQALHGRGE